MTKYEDLSLGFYGGELNDIHHTGNFVDIPDEISDKDLIKLLRKNDMVRGRINMQLLEVEWQYTQIEIRYKGKIAMILQKAIDNS